MSSASRMSANVGRLYLFQALANASLWMPIWVVFLDTDRHLTLGEVYLIAGIGWVIMAAAEVPTGALADTYGRRVTLLIGCATLALGLVLLATLSGLAGVLVAYLFWAAGNALLSGTDTAMLYDSAVAAGRESEFERMASTSFQILLAAQATGSIAGGLLGAIDLRIPILVTAALTLAALVVVLRMAEPPRHEPGSGTSVAQTLRLATVFVRRQPRIFALLAYAATLAGIAFFVPFVLFQPAMREHDVAVAWLGVLFTGLRLGALAGSRYGPRLVGAGGLVTWIWLTPTLAAAGLVAIAVSGAWWLAFAAMVAVAAVDAAIRPALTTQLNRHLSGSVRATVMSMQGLTMTVFIAAMHPAVGGVADAAGTTGAFIFLAAACAAPWLLGLPLRTLATAGGTVAAPGHTSFATGAGHLEDG